MLANSDGPALDLRFQLHVELLTGRSGSQWIY
jgi:hypothetical protein